MMDQNQQQKDKIVPPEVDQAMKMWEHYISANLDVDNTQKVLDMMVSGSRDSGWIYHGGSGARSLFILVDDYIQIRFDFQKDDSLVSYAVLPKPGPWLKTPDGILLKGGEYDENSVVQLPPKNDNT